MTLNSRGFKSTSETFETQNLITILIDLPKPVFFQYVYNGFESHWSNYSSSSPLEVHTVQKICATVRGFPLCTNRRQLKCFVQWWQMKGNSLWENRQSPWKKEENVVRLHNSSDKNHNSQRNGFFLFCCFCLQIYIH